MTKREIIELLSDCEDDEDINILINDKIEVDIYGLDVIKKFYCGEAYGRLVFTCKTGKLK